MQGVITASCGCSTDRRKPEGDRRTRCAAHTPTGTPGRHLHAEQFHQQALFSEAPRPEPHQQALF